jgi:hypothetical protein
MGLDRESLRFLLRCRAEGVEFRKTITIGRQDLLVTATDLLDEFAGAGWSLDSPHARRLLTQHDRFADGLLNHIGADVVDSMDASHFEGATVLQDLNEPLAVHLRQAYTAVVELGTIEHVFNFPQAIKNLMDMVAVGGHLIIVTPCNNFMGHGFYQFSPELFFRVLSAENGYRLLEMIYYHFGESDWYRVSDPAALRSRVGHNTTAFPSQLMILARREATGDLLTRWPTQSDYNAEWMERPGKARDPDRLAWFTKQLDASGDWPAQPAWKRVLKALIPEPVRRPVAAWKLGRRVASPPDPRFFDKLQNSTRRSRG